MPSRSPSPPSTSETTTTPPIASLIPQPKCGVATETSMSSVWPSVDIPTPEPPAPTPALPSNDAKAAGLGPPNKAVMLPRGAGAAG